MIDNYYLAWYEPLPRYLLLPMIHIELEDNLRLELIIVLTRLRIEETTLEKGQQTALYTPQILRTMQKALNTGCNWLA